MYDGPGKFLRARMTMSKVPPPPSHGIVSGQNPVKQSGIEYKKDKDWKHAVVARNYQPPRIQQLQMRESELRLWEMLVQAQLIKSTGMATTNSG